MVCSSRFLLHAVRVAAFCGVGSSMVVVMIDLILQALFWDLVRIVAIAAIAGAAVVGLIWWAVS